MIIKRPVTTTRYISSSGRGYDTLCQAAIEEYRDIVAKELTGKTYDLLNSSDLKDKVTWIITKICQHPTLFRNLSQAISNIEED